MNMKEIVIKFDLMEYLFLYFSDKKSDLSKYLCFICVNKRPLKWSLF